MSEWLATPLLTGRLRLRPWAESDEAAVVALKMDPEVRRFLGGPQPPEKAVAGTRQQIGAQHWGHFVVTLADRDEAIGTVTFDRKRDPWELSLQLRRDHWGRGLMTEAVPAVILWLFDNVPEAQEVIAVTQSDNERTRALLLRCGAIYDKTFREHEAEQMQYVFARP